jgi:hypothetical protein
MTGVRDLFSDLQPVTGNKSTLSLSAGRCGAGCAKTNFHDGVARTGFRVSYAVRAPIAVAG